MEIKVMGRTDNTALPEGTPVPASAGGFKQPAFNGERIKSNTNDAVYFVYDGMKAWIPNPTVYLNLFKDWSGISILAQATIDTFESTDPLSPGASLIKGSSKDPVYFFANGKKHWIPSPEIFNNMCFNWDKIHTCPQEVVDSLPNGNNLSWKC